MSQSINLEAPHPTRHAQSDDAPEPFGQGVGAAWVVFIPACMIIHSLLVVWLSIGLR